MKCRRNERRQRRANRVTGKEEEKIQIEEEMYEKVEGVQEGGRGGSGLASFVASRLLSFMPDDQSCAIT